MDSEDRTCRICSSAGTTLNLVNIFEKKDGQQTVVEMLLELAGIKVVVDDKLPKLCCSLCHAELAAAVSTRRKCLKSEKRSQPFIEYSFSHEYNDSDSDEESLKTPIYHCCECALDFFNSETLHKHYESMHANVFYDSVENREVVDLFDTTTDEEDLYQSFAKTIPVPQRDTEQYLNYRCCGCVQSFNDEAELKVHSGVVHASKAPPANEYKTHQCNICFRSFMSEQAVLDHQYKSRLTRHQCAICGILCSTLKKLEQHEMTHNGETFYCDICEKSFAHSDSLRAHRRNKHTDPLKGGTPKRHVCEQCGKCYNSSSYLKNHVKLHSDAAPYCCELCGARFKLSIYLKWHMTRHNSSYNCKQCYVSFKSASELQAHQYRHSGRKNFPCPICTKHFYTKKDAQKHRALVHKKHNIKEI